MKNTLVVVADLGCYKAFRIDGSHLGPTPRLELVEEGQLTEAHSRLVDKVTDLSGRFPRGTGTRANGTMSDGERHNIELETRKRLVRQLAQRLNALARTQPAERWFFAASREINHQLLEELDPQLRAKIQKVVPADLTKVDRAELLQHF